MIQKDKSSQIDSTTFNVERLMSSIEPCILKMVVLLTRSCRSSRKPINTLVSELPHTKKLCCFYCVCVLLFCTNNQCSMPVHILLTDIDSHGGTTELKRILNRVGGVASNDTHARYMEAIVENRRSSGIATQLKKNFTVTSVDNIDFLQSHAAVYSGDQHRSWHGTSIQAVQPTLNPLEISILPSTSFTCNSEPSTRNTANHSSLPVSRTSSLPVSQTSSVPVSQTSSVPVSRTSSLPVSRTSSLPVSQTSSLPVSRTSSLPVS